MSVMLSGNSEENFGEGKGTVDNATAAYYTALKYYSEGKTEIPVNEFCKSMSANFQGSKTYSKDVLSSIAQGLLLPMMEKAQLQSMQEQVIVY